MSSDSSTLGGYEIGRGSTARERVTSAALNEEAVTLSDEMKNDGLAG